ncbi:MAG: hypothetical protein NTZ09_03865 [Candidatus Hydrogenedentes bacterium]|nr:hypothetical protein [Candidatus Hydrogenedentota bacterium]
MRRHFTVGWAHLFVGDGLSEGNFSDGNGLLFNGGTDNDDPDYVLLSVEFLFSCVEVEASMPRVGTPPGSWGAWGC